MNSARALNVLYEAEGRLSNRFARVLNLLKGPSRIRSLLVQTQKRPGGEWFERLWETATGAAAKLHIERRDTDWVFENFWPNAKEPKHSKLLAFFLNPKEHHGCGPLLLEKLLSILEMAARASHRRNSKVEPRFLADDCTVQAESGGYIDLRIERERDDGKFAILIENKINGAPDQYGFRVSAGRETSQLERCVERVHRRFDYHEIYVFYLPLEGERDARPEDVNAITQDGRGVTYTRITFKDHISDWLAIALKDWPEDLNQDLREHLSYYARLITYLVNKNKQIEMDSEILKSIQQEEEGGFLSLSAIDAAVESALSLKRVFERVLRGRLLRRICDEFRRSNLHADFYVHPQWPLLHKVEPASDYADEFEKAMVVGTEVNAAIAVGFGWDNENGFFFAYLRLNDDEGQFDDVVQMAARASLLGEIVIGEPRTPYYAYKYEGVTAEQCEEQKTAADTAMRIREMRERLQQALPSIGNS